MIFSSDNGGVRYPQSTQNAEFNGSQPSTSFSGQKTEAYEGGVHMPLLVRWPGVTKAVILARIVISMKQTVSDWIEG